MFRKSFLNCLSLAGLHAVRRAMGRAPAFFLFENCAPHCAVVPFIPNTTALFLFPSLSLQKKPKTNCITEFNSNSTYVLSLRRCSTHALTANQALRLMHTIVQWRWTVVCKHVLFFRLFLPFVHFPLFPFQSINLLHSHDASTCPLHYVLQ